MKDLENRFFLKLTYLEKNLQLNNTTLKNNSISICIKVFDVTPKNEIGGHKSA